MHDRYILFLDSFLSKKKIVFVVDFRMFVNAMLLMQIREHTADNRFVCILELQVQEA